ncbi:MAG: hypothetical protein JO302_05885 [Candidatus Eremiobacteraeota bacterium]|nr:hypothetical protein [Candidatus Eremiobacteraeota bacterium]
MFAGRTNATPAPPADRSSTLLGSWLCITAARTTAKLTFVRPAAGSMALENHFTLADGSTAEFDEQYTFDTNSGRWMWKTITPNDRTFEEDGSAPPWTGDRWLFEGTLHVAAQASMASILPPKASTGPVRMLYIYVDGNTFRRSFQQQANGEWVTTSSSICQRAVSP